jgi:hypothetical protein
VKATVEKPDGIGLGSRGSAQQDSHRVNKARFGPPASTQCVLRVSRWDLGLHRSFHMRGEMTLHLRAEAVNVTSTPKFTYPRSTAGRSWFGEIFSSYGEHEMRLGLRLGF